MLLAIILALSALAAVGAAFGGGLLAAVLSFVGTFLGLLLLAAAVLLIAAAVVNKDQPQESDSRLYRWLAHLYLDFAIAVGRIKIHTKGLENTPKSGRFLLVCNHLSDIDPALVLHCFRNSQLSFISKQENRNMPIVGSFMHRLMCQMINRENDREALKTILKCIQMIKDDQVSVAVFPEGYVSLDGKLRHFRGGVFKIAQKTGVPIVVCTLQNTKQAMDKLLKLQPSEVTLHLVRVIGPEEVQGMSTVDVAEMIYEIMISDLGEHLRTDEKGMHPDLQRKRMEQ